MKFVIQQIESRKAQGRLGIPQIYVEGDKEGKDGVLFAVHCPEYGKTGGFIDAGFFDL